MLFLVSLLACTGGTETPPAAPSSPAGATPAATPAPPTPAPPAVADPAAAATPAVTDPAAPAAATAADPLAAVPAATSSPATDSALFTKWPGCEVSAALDLGDGNVLLADNEVPDRLAVVPWAKGDTGLLDPSGAKWQRIEGSDGKTWRVDDLEALAKTAQGVLAIGSHSRKSFKSPLEGCVADAQRTRAATLTLGSDHLSIAMASDLEDGNDNNRPGPRSILSSPGACARWFTGGANVLCPALVIAEISAGDKTESGCASALNFEAATTVNRSTWWGMRSPLPSDGAWVVRASGMTTAGPRFDAAATVHTRAGYGIRELATDGANVIALTGPYKDAPADTDPQPFTMISFPASALRNAAAILPEWQVDVPSGAEGMVIRDGKALLFVDGAKGEEKDGSLCKESSRQLLVPLPIKE